MPDPTDTPILTAEESGKVAQALFDPTVNRIVVLLQTLMQATASGDYAIWASLVALDRVIKDLDWTAVSRDHAQHFALLAELVFARCAERMRDYRAAILAWDGVSPFPALAPWSNEDTTAVLQLVAESGPAAPEEKPNVE